MWLIVVIASSTRGFAIPQADTPPVIRPYAAPLQDQDEKGSVIAGHVILALPFVFLIMGAALERFRFSLLEAARDLGAGTWTIFRTVTLPLLRPAVLGAMFLAMAISVDEFVIAFFTAGSQQTLPLVLYGRINLGVNPGLNAIGSVLLVVTMSLAFLAARTSVLELP